MLCPFIWFSHNDIYQTQTRGSAGFKCVRYKYVNIANTAIWTVFDFRFNVIALAKKFDVFSFQRKKQPTVKLHYKYKKNAFQGYNENSNNRNAIIEGKNECVRAISVNTWIVRTVTIGNHQFHLRT